MAVLFGPLHITRPSNSARRQHLFELVEIGLRQCLIHAQLADRDVVFMFLEEGARLGAKALETVGRAEARQVDCRLADAVTP